MNGGSAQILAKLYTVESSHQKQLLGFEVPVLIF
jgi:hypothetical protein